MILGSTEGPRNIPQTLRITMWARITTIHKASIGVQDTRLSESLWAFRTMMTTWPILCLSPRDNLKISTRTMEMDLVTCTLEKKTDRQNNKIMYLMRKLFSTISVNSNQTIKLLSMTRKVRRVNKNIIQIQ